MFQHRVHLTPLLERITMRVYSVGSQSPAIYISLCSYGRLVPSVGLHTLIFACCGPLYLMGTGGKLLLFLKVCGVFPSLLIIAVASHDHRVVFVQPLFQSEKKTSTHHIAVFWLVIHRSHLLFVRGIHQWQGTNNAKRFPCHEMLWKVPRIFK